MWSSGLSPSDPRSARSPTLNVEGGYKRIFRCLIDAVPDWAALEIANVDAGGSNATIAGVQNRFERRSPLRLSALEEPGTLGTRGQRALLLLNRDSNAAAVV